MAPSSSRKLIHYPGALAVSLALLVVPLGIAIFHERRSAPTEGEPGHVVATRAPENDPAGQANEDDVLEPSYDRARLNFRTKLVRHGPAPQSYQNESPPPGVKEIQYRSGELTLKAWLSMAPADGKPRSAVLLLHGGFAFGGDWGMAGPYLEAGFTVMMPMLRGENGLEGDYSMFYDEVEDVMAAGRALFEVPYVRTDHVYVAGHSVGGTLAILASMATSRFRAVASFAGSPDQFSWSKGQPELIPFDPRDRNEFLMRSPLVFPGSFQCPARLYHGRAETYFAGPTAKLAFLAQEKGLDVRAVVIEGDHMTHLPEAIRQSIQFFREKE